MAKPERLSHLAYMPAPISAIESNRPFASVAVLWADISRDDIMELAWSEGLSVGNAMIDFEHRNLLKMINDVENAIRKRDSAALPRLLELLEEAVSIHFSDEEKIAQAISFDFTHNKLDHRYVQNELRHMRGELAFNNGAWSESVAEYYSCFLGEWMIQHILQEDMLLKPVLQTYPYDFKPD